MCDPCEHQDAAQMQTVGSEQLFFFSCRVPKTHSRGQSQHDSLEVSLFSPIFWMTLERSQRDKGQEQTRMSTSASGDGILAFSVLVVTASWHLAMLAATHKCRDQDGAQPRSMVAREEATTQLVPRARGTDRAARRSLRGPWGALH